MTILLIYSKPQCCLISKAKILSKFKISDNIKNLGTENAFVVLARSAELERQGHDVINLGIGQPDYKTADHIVQAAIKALKDGHHGYTPGNGILELREAVVENIKTKYSVLINNAPDLSEGLEINCCDEPSTSPCEIELS